MRVWLYGGSNTGGSISNPLYDGCAASKTTVQVSLNYRLGPLGFLAATQVGLTGNYGLQDQLLGLRWVQDNIAAFGGDPAHVVLFGQSAGATDAWALSTLPQARGLFSAVILESSVPDTLPDLAAASATSAPLLAALRCTTAACLRAVNVTALRTAFFDSAPAAGLIALNASYPRSALTPGLGLVLDGVVVPAQPLAVGPAVPAIVGSNTNEASLFVLSGLRLAAFELEEGAYESFLFLAFPNATRRAAVKARYPYARFAGAPENQAAAAIAAVATDQHFRCPARRVLAGAAARGVPVWTYSFGLTPSCAWDPRVPALDAVMALLGATHGAELVYVFGAVDGLPRPGGTCALSAGDKAVSAAMVDAWASMAARAQPGGGWPAYDAVGSGGVNMVNGTWAIGKVDYSMCDFWDGIEETAPGANGTGTGSGTPTTSSGPPSATSTNAARGRPGVRTAASVAGVVWLISMVGL